MPRPWSSPIRRPGYYALLLTGLIFCLGGDVLLALAGQQMFRLGLVSFLLGHVWYFVAFLRISPTGPATWAAGIAAAGVGIVIFRWLRPHLGAMKIPVILYIVVISAMLCGAVSVGADPGLRPAARVLVGAGALLFYLSDLFVARHRFVRTEFFNRLIGLPLYYTGQFLIAFSVGTVA